MASLADPAVIELLARATVDPADGLQVVALDRLVARPFDPGMALLLLPPAGPDGADAHGTVPGGMTPGATPGARGPAADAEARSEDAPVPGRHAHGADPVALLRRLYPSEHPVLGSVGEPQARIGSIEEAALAAAPHLIPALGDIENVASPFGIAWLADRLRRPDGCPWDREQDHGSLRPFLLEETYEVYDALEGGSTPKLAEELGDLLLQVVLHAQYAAEDGVFDLADVYAAITSKIIRRHPHVFGDVEAATANDVMRNWEQLKAAERSDEADHAGEAGAAASTVQRRDPEMPAAFAGLSRSLPALAYADEMQGRAASLGYDWPDLEGVIDKIAEEASELLTAVDDRQRHEEYGDLLFVLVNMGRKLGIDPEASLRAASRKFAARFARVERLADARGVELRALGLDALDDLWQEVKREEEMTEEGR